MKNFLLAIFGVLFCISLGLVIGFWLQIFLTPKLPNGFYECKDCGNISYADTYRFFKKK